MDWCSQPYRLNSYTAKQQKIEYLHISCSTVLICCSYTYKVLWCFMHLVNSADTCLCCANSAHIMHIYLPGTGVFHGIVFAPALYSVLSPQMMNSWVHRFLSKIAKFFSSYGFFLASTFIHSIPRSLFQFTYLFSSLQVQFLPRRPSLFPMQQNG